MKILTPVFNIIAMVCIVFYVVAYTNMSRTISRDFNQSRYNYAVQQATEAMFRSTLHAEDIGLDYTDMSYISIDASDALQIFDRVICANYNMAPSDENFGLIHDSISGCIIAGYDGYYILKATPTDSVDSNGKTVDSFELRFSPKVPYLITTGSYTYAIDYYKKTYTYLRLNSRGIEGTKQYITGTVLPGGLTEKDVLTMINQQLKSALIAESQNNGRNKHYDINRLSLTFPTSTTKAGVNPFGIPGIFVMMDDSRFASTEQLKVYSAAGYKAIKRDRLIAFTDTRTNRSFYCFEHQLRDEEKTVSSGGTSNSGYFDVENFFDNMKVVAEHKNKAGDQYYQPYYELLARKISKD